MTTKKIRASGGFTLIELLMVVSIVAMLSSIILSAIADAKSKANDSAGVNAMQQTRNAIGLYFLDYGDYPTDLSVLVTKNYIPSIDKRLYYNSLVSPSQFDACSENCQYYHLAISLKAKAGVLQSDADIVSPIINGKVDNCLNGNSSSPDFCYDITP
ncbi:MAG: type II secretion system protein [Minisyncoccia bacterium]